MKSIIAILLFVTSNNLHAQYLHYKDRSNINKTSSPANPPVSKFITQVPEPAKPLSIPPVHIKNSIPPKSIMIAPAINSVTVSDFLVPVIDSQIVYHTWPDMCPGRPGSIPVLNNYVPHELVLKLTEIFQGHLYAITSIKVDNNKMNYQLKVCINGEIKYEQADEYGNL
jgi:hypothetical protein